MCTRVSRRQTSFIVALIASTFLMGSSFIAGKVLMSDGFSPMILVGWRFIVAALATLPLVFFESRDFKEALLPRGFRIRDCIIVALIGLTQTGAVMGLLFTAMKSISASTAAILLFTNPIWVAILGRLFLAEPLSRNRIAGLLIGLIGVVFAIGLRANVGPGDGTAIGKLIGLLSAFCWASATITHKRTKLPIGSWALTFWQMLIGAMALLGVAYAGGERWPQSTTLLQWGWFLWLAIPASTGSFGLWFVALSQGGATRASAYLFLAPLFTVILSFVVLDTSLTWIQAMGGVFIGAALWLINREGPRRNNLSGAAEGLADGEP